MAKNYATSSSQNKSCYFRCDYSYEVNHKCLDCKFCYSKLAPQPRLKVRVGKLIDIEKDWNRHLYKVPITVSRYCEPFRSAASIRSSIYVMNHVLSNGGQIILRTSLANMPKEAFDLLTKYKNNVQFQPRISFAEQTTLSKEIKRELSPHTSTAHTLLNQARILSEHGVETAVFFDPLIVDCNVTDLQDICKSLRSFNVSNIIVRQLFATPYFKHFLSMSNKRLALLLTENVGSYSTYKNEVLLKALIPTIDIAADQGLNLSMCCNRQVNEVLGLNINCCLFTKAQHVYELDKLYKHSSIREGNV